MQETLSITDRAYLLFEGKILKAGSAEELAADEQVRKVYLGQNFELKRKIPIVPQGESKYLVLTLTVRKGPLFSGKILLYMSIISPAFKGYIKLRQSAIDNFMHNPIDTQRRYSTTLSARHSLQNTVRSTTLRI